MRVVVDAAVPVEEDGIARLGLVLPAPVALETIPEGTRRFYTSNQRVSNKLLKQTLDFKFSYPSYRQGAATEFQEQA